MVPDRAGRYTLSLETDTTRTLEEGLSTTVHREDRTEVEVHESSLETFVQTDKPMYKPGETGLFEHPNKICLADQYSNCEKKMFLGLKIYIHVCFCLPCLSYIHVLE